VNDFLPPSTAVEAIQYSMSVYLNKFNFNVSNLNRIYGTKNYNISVTWMIVALVFTLCHTCNICCIIAICIISVSLTSYQ